VCLNFEQPYRKRLPSCFNLWGHTRIGCRGTVHKGRLPGAAEFVSCGARGTMVGYIYVTIRAG